MRYLTIIFCAVLVLLSLQQAQAKIIHVPADSSTIQGGINGAVDGDTVLVAPGTYNENIDFEGKRILLTSNFLFGQDTSAINVTIIDGDSSGRVVTFDSGEDSASILQGFTVCNGYINIVGGGVFCHYSSPTIRYNRITENNALHGGGIYCLVSSPTITENVISNNEVAETGGGIRCRLSSPIIQSNIIAENSARFGGGVYCEQSSSPTIVNNEIIGNEATSSGGGGVGCTNTGTFDSYPIIHNNLICYNSTMATGGGIYCNGDYMYPVITNNIIVRNSADGAADEGGGGIYCYNNSPDIINNTISYNSAPKGGNIYCGSVFTEPTIVNNIITHSTDGEGVFWYLGTAWFGLTYNVLWGNAAGNFANAPSFLGDTTWGTNFNGTPCDSFYNIIRAPFFADTTNDDFSLACSSVCIDVGDTIYYVPHDSGGCRIDIGALEYPYILGDANSDSIIEIADVVFVINYLFANGPSPCPYHAGDANCDGVIDAADVVYLINYLYAGGPPPGCP